MRKLCDKNIGYECSIEDMDNKMEKNDLWIPCDNKKCKNRHIFINFDKNFNLKRIGCHKHRRKNDIMYGEINIDEKRIYFKNGDMIDCNCPLILEWYMCNFGILKKFEKIIEKAEILKFDIEFGIDKEKNIYIKNISRNRNKN